MVVIFSELTKSRESKSLPCCFLLFIPWVMAILVSLPVFWTYVYIQEQPGLQNGGTCARVRIPHLCIIAVLILFFQSLKCQTSVKLWSPKISRSSSWVLPWRITDMSQFPCFWDLWHRRLTWFTVSACMPMYIRMPPDTICMFNKYVWFNLNLSNASNWILTGISIHL